MFDKRAYITEVETVALLEYVSKATEDVIEIGTDKGGTTVNFAKVLPPDISLWTIDIWMQLGYAEVAEFERVFPIVGNSNYIGQCWCRDIGFLFIDGGHDYHTVLTDFQVWTPWLIPEGVVALHDACIPLAEARAQNIKLPVALNNAEIAGEAGVIQAVAEIVNTGGWKVVDVVDTTLFFTRTERK